MWKDFFYYSKFERRAIVLLLLLVIISGTALIVWRGLSDGQMSVREEKSAAIDSFLAGVSVRERRFVSPVQQHRQPSEKLQVRLSPFDPNVADSVQLRSLGLGVFVVRNILRYREKGGVFRKPEALSRIYGLTDSQYVALKPYIRITSDFHSVSPRRDDSVLVRSVGSKASEHVLTVVRKLPEGSVVPLNQSDTTLLKQIPGIGSGFAKMIVSYRNRLGGFYRVEQLQEIPNIGPEINKWFEPDGIPYRQIRVNQDGLDRLKSHPYMDFYKARAIVEFRRKRGRIKGMSQIAMFEEFSEDDLKRLEPYFSFD